LKLPHFPIRLVAKPTPPCDGLVNRKKQALILLPAFLKCTCSKYRRLAAARHDEYAHLSDRLRLDSTGTLLVAALSPHSTGAPQARCFFCEHRKKNSVAA